MKSTKKKGKKTKKKCNYAIYDILKLDLVLKERVFPG